MIKFNDSLKVVFKKLDTFSFQEIKNEIDTFQEKFNPPTRDC